jgi:hypothetical protein
VKRILSLILTLSLLLTGVAFAGTSADIAEISGLTYLDVPAKQFGGLTTTSTLRLDQVDVKDSTLEMLGELRYGNAAYPIHLTGTFYQSQLGQPSDKVATVRDLNDQFKVLHMAVRRNPAPEALLVNKSVTGPVLFLYLQRNGTREVTLVEAPITGLAHQNSLLQLLGATREKGHFGGDFWAAKLFQATDSQSSTSDVGILAVQDTDIREYYETYWPTPSCWQTYKIRFHAFVNGATDIARGSSDYNHELKILRKWTESNCAYYVTENSPYVLGTYDDLVKVRVKTWGNDSTDGDVLLKGWFDGNFQTKITLSSSVYLNFGLSYKWASINISGNLCCFQTAQEATTVVYSQANPDKWTKIVENNFDDRYLRDVNQNFIVVTQLAWGAGAWGSKPLDTLWTVPIYADYDDFSSTLYYQTTSYPDTTVWYTSG